MNGKIQVCYLIDSKKYPIFLYINNKISGIIFISIKIIRGYLDEKAISSKISATITFEAFSNIGRSAPNWENYSLKTTVFFPQRTIQTVRLYQF